jgi:hypothetical protein
MYLFSRKYEKAFDREWRDGLFHKLLLNNINGKMYNIIFNQKALSLHVVNHDKVVMNNFPSLDIRVTLKSKMFKKN